jgi:tetratricopeptide (TPR) repeat protein
MITHITIYEDTPMERTSKTEPTTGTISNDLDRIEILVGRVGYNTPEQTRSLPPALDSAYLRIQELENGESRARVEVRFESLLTILRSEARRFIKDFGGMATYLAERARENPPASHSWWYLDEYLASKRKAALRRLLMTVGILAAVLVVLALIYNRFLAPDPKFLAAYEHQQLARDYFYQGNPQQALQEAETALTYTPDDSSLWILKAVALEKLGRDSEAAQAYAKAEQLEPDREQFLLARVDVYISAGMYDQAMADTQEVLKINPDSAQAFLAQGMIYEGTKQYSDAIDAYNKATEVANKINQPETAALARTRYAMLLQMMSGQSLQTPEDTVTP